MPRADRFFLPRSVLPPGSEWYDTLIIRLGLALAIGPSVAWNGAGASAMRLQGTGTRRNSHIRACRTPRRRHGCAVTCIRERGRLRLWVPRLRHRLWLVQVAGGEGGGGGSSSVTGAAAALAVFGLGGLSVVGLTIAPRLRPASRSRAWSPAAEALHGLLRQVSWVELRSALLLAGMTAIVLPLLPNRPIDPWGGVNPWQIWFFTVLTAAISYGGTLQCACSDREGSADQWPRRRARLLDGGHARLCPPRDDRRTDAPACGRPAWLR